MESTVSSLRFIRYNAEKFIAIPNPSDTQNGLLYSLFLIKHMSSGYTWEYLFPAVCVGEVGEGYTFIFSTSSFHICAVDWASIEMFNGKRFFNFTTDNSVMYHTLQRNAVIYQNLRSNVYGWLRFVPSLGMIDCRKRVSNDMSDFFWQSTITKKWSLVVVQ